MLRGPHERTSRLTAGPRLTGWNHCFNVCTNGAPSVMGCRKGCVSYVVKVNPNIRVFQCMWHRDNLASRELSVSVHNRMNNIFEIVGFLKDRALNSRLSQKLC